MNKSKIQSFCPTPSLAFVTKFQRPLNWKNFRFEKDDNNSISNITVDSEEVLGVTRDIYERLKIHNWKNTRKLSLEMGYSWIEVKLFKQAICNIGNITGLERLNLKFSCLDNVAFKQSLENLGFMISKKLNNLKVLELVFDEISLSEGEEMTILGKTLFRNLTHLQHLSSSFPRMKRFDKQALNKFGSAICQNLIHLKSLTLNIESDDYYRIGQGVTFDDNSLNKWAAQDFVLKIRRSLYNLNGLNLHLTWYRRTEFIFSPTFNKEIVLECYKERYDYDEKERDSFNYLFNKDKKRKENLRNTGEPQFKSQRGKKIRKREEFENFEDTITFKQNNEFEFITKEHMLLKRKKVETIESSEEKVKIDLNYWHVIAE